MEVTLQGARLATLSCYVAMARGAGSEVAEKGRGGCYENELVGQMLTLRLLLTAILNPGILVLTSTET